MNEQEKELKDILSDFLEKFEMDTYNRHVYLESLSKAIIAKYPQITKKPVRLHPTQLNVPHSHRYAFEQLDRFYSSEDRQAWIDSHYVELVG